MSVDTLVGSTLKWNARYSIWIVREHSTDTLMDEIRTSRGPAVGFYLFIVMSESCLFLCVR